GQRVTKVRLGDPLVLRATKPFDQALQGRTLTDVAHRGRFLVFGFDDGSRVVINPMLSGLFDLIPPETKIRAKTAFALTFDNGMDLRYRDDTRMGKVYLLGPGQSDADVPQYSSQGEEAGALGWSADEFAKRAKATRRELRNLLMDDEFLAGIGNAYADEILWTAKLHPKRRVATLDEGEMDRLRVASAKQLGAHRRPRKAAAIRTVGGHRVVAVGDRDDRDLERQLVARETARVALAVVALVVREHELSALEELRDVAQQFVSDANVALHLLPLVIVERALLQQDHVVRADLADVVHARRIADERDLRGLELHAAREAL